MKTQAYLTVLIATVLLAACGGGSSGGNEASAVAVDDPDSPPGVMAEAAAQIARPVDEVDAAEPKAVDPSALVAYDSNETQAPAVLK
ncbi:hypothetical protein R0381_000299 [Jeongeupia wiesaeckerbachi]|uniref:hypothetical protein n=1 Tax=Jeongeupia wiesaeckerbachi TaxID=3051218 RepID=UPI003D805269